MSATALAVAAPVVADQGGGDTDLSTSRDPSTRGRWHALVGPRADDPVLRELLASDVTVRWPRSRIAGIKLSRREMARWDGLSGREARQNGRTLFDALAALITSSSYQREPAFRRGVLVRAVVDAFVDQAEGVLLAERPRLWARVEAAREALRGRELRLASCERCARLILTRERDALCLPCEGS